MAREQPNVLFVNIGWTEIYDGEHTISGGMIDIIDQNGDPMKLGEGIAFLPDSNGFVKCTAGPGQVIPSSSIDLVFVTHNPLRFQHEIVGIYFEPTFSYSPWTNRKGNTRTWADASTKCRRELPGNQRPAIAWPTGRHMRRWVRRFGIIRYPELFNKYLALV